MRRTAPARRAVTVIGAITASALLAACTVGPSQRPPVVVRGDPLPPAVAAPSALPTPGDTLPETRPGRSTIGFFDCTGESFTALGIAPPTDRTLGVECGELTVPADPAQPAAGDTTLTIQRVAAARTSGERPPLVVIGDSVTGPSSLVALTVATRVPVEVLDHYDIVGIDRRGSGSDDLACAPPEAVAAIVDADPSATTEPVLSQLLEQARDVVQKCNLTLKGGVGGYRTSSTSADIESVRAALGVDRLTAIGIGDGAAALGSWARSTPRSVARVVLDGPPQPGLDEPDLIDGRAKATEAAFTAFATACVATPRCPLGPDPRAAVTALVGSLTRNGLDLPDGRNLSAGAALLALRLGLSEPRTWPELATALAAAGAGDGTALLGLLDPVIGRRGDFDEMLATSCNDSAHRFSPGEVAAIADRMRSAYPLVGADMALELLACAPWPTTAAPADPGPGGPGLPPMLVIGTAADPRTPADGARRAAETIPGARFLSWQGAGTGAYPRTPCVTAVVDAMLLNGTVPQDGTLCPP